MDISLLDAYLNDVPRCASDEWRIGPFTVYLGKSGFSFYARPLSQLADRPPTDAEIIDVLNFLTDHQVPIAFEWLPAMVHPDFTKPLVRLGLRIHRYPLLVLKEFTPSPPPPGYTIRTLAPDEDTIAVAWSTLDLAFANPEKSTIGLAERDLHVNYADPGLSLRRTLMAKGLAVMAVAEGNNGPVSAGSHNPRDAVTELVGIATLPAYRGNGLARAVTCELVRDAQSRGVKTCFLTAEDDRIASLYESLGFIRIGESLTASLDEGLDS
jgi:ribosomal protein S18 acetylase RimI-like enzyme